MADEKVTEDYVPEFDKTAYVGVDPMYQNAANPTEYPLVPPEQEGVLTENEGQLVREVPSTEAANTDLNADWSGVSDSADQVDDSADDDVSGDADDDAEKESAKPAKAAAKSDSDQ